MNGCGWVTVKPYTKQASGQIWSTNLSLATSALELCSPFTSSLQTRKVWRKYTHFFNAQPSMLTFSQWEQVNTVKDLPTCRRTRKCCSASTSWLQLYFGGGNGSGEELLIFNISCVAAVRIGDSIYKVPGTEKHSMCYTFYYSALIFFNKNSSLHNLSVFLFYYGNYPLSFGCVLFCDYSHTLPPFLFLIQC